MPKYDVAAKLREQQGQTSGGQAVYESKESKRRKKKKHKEKLDRAVYEITKGKDPAFTRKISPIVLTEKKVIPAVVEKEFELAIYTEIPNEYEYPGYQIRQMSSVSSGSDQVRRMASASMLEAAAARPASTWEFSGTSVSLFGTTIGALMVMVGKSVVAQMAMAGAEQFADSRFQRTLANRGVSVRFHTGRGPGKGNYKRTRPEGGSFADDDADPHDPPSDWWAFWDWF